MDPVSGRAVALQGPVGHDLVSGELLTGDRGGRAKLLSAYEQMHQASTIPHRDVVAFVRHRGLHGRGLRWIDVHLLASAIVGRMQLWTADSQFSAVADELGVAYKPPAPVAVAGKPGLRWYRML